MLKSAESQEASNCLAAAANACAAAAQLAQVLLADHLMLSFVLHVRYLFCSCSLSFLIQTMGRSDLVTSDYMRTAELWAFHGDLNKSAETYSKVAAQVCGYLRTFSVSLSINLLLVTD
jgi:hypothetical protein